MTTFSMPSRRAPGLLLIAVLHLGLLYAFLQARPHPEEDHAPRGPAIQWLRYVPPPAPTKPRAAPLATLPGKPVAARQAAPITVPPPARPAPAEAPTPPAPPAVAETPAPAAPSAADILAQARRDVGRIDKELRKEFPQRGEQKFEDTAYKRMQQGFADAYAAVPPKWYEASRIEEVGANEARGSRTYKITSALGTLCVTTRAGKNGETMIGNCPK